MKHSVSEGTARFARSLHLDDQWMVGWMAVAFGLRLFFWIYTGRTWEDALITVLHSENFYHGLGLTHFSIDDSRPLHGFTSPLSVLVPLLADRFHVGWGLPFQKLLSLISGPVAVWFGYRILRDHLAPHNRAAAVLGAGYLAIEHHQILWGMAGMETQMATAIVLASIYFLFSNRLTACAVTCGLCLLARPDFVLWVGVAGVAIAYKSYERKSFKPLVKFSLQVSAIYGPWVLFTTLYYGSPIPNSITAKNLGYIGYWEVATSFAQLMTWAFLTLINAVCAPLRPVWGGNGTGFVPLVGGSWLVVLLLAIIGFGLFVEFKRRRWDYIPIYAFAALSAAFLTFRAPNVFGWYTVPLCAVLALLLAKAIADINDIYSTRAVAAFSWIFAATYLASFAAVLPTTFRAERNVQSLVENKVLKVIGLCLANTPPETTIGGEPLGYMGYYSRRTFYDYPGLCSRKVTTWLKEHKYPRIRKMLEVFDYVRPDYLVLRRMEYNANLQNPKGAFLRDEYELEQEFVVTAEDRAKLFHPESNIDLDFVLLVNRNKVKFPPSCRSANQ